MEIVTREDGVGFIDGFGGDEKLLLFSGLPEILEMTVSAGVFIAEVPAVDAFALVSATLRLEKGHDIGAACGQLRLKKVQGTL